MVLEALESFGGTWWMHRYPGVRSDSDLYTFGYRFKPWTGTPIASAAEIRKYMGDVISENGLDRHIRYQHRITGELVERGQQWTVGPRERIRARRGALRPASSGCVRGTTVTPKATRQNGPA